MSNGDVWSKIEVVLQECRQVLCPENTSRG